MLKINRKLSKEGFSLIELMVAVVILAMAIFGIFHAYSVGFRGMADSRDRTVATNYAREAMEDIKSLDFEQIMTQSRKYIGETKFEREVIVQHSTNLKKVTTKVYWNDRRGNPKMVETDMVVHFIETTAGAPSRIMLIANPYNVLTEGGTSTLRAVVKDVKGNTVTTYNGNITFNITSGNDKGYLSSSSVSADQGIATTTFTASSKGEVTITASADGLNGDSVTIKITDPDEPVKINLDVTLKFMKASESSTSEIKATIVNSVGDPVIEATNEITFNVSGPGTLSNQTALSDGVVKITLTSNGTPGTITVTASSTGLEPDIVDVITGGQISLSASKMVVPNIEKSEITVTTKDVNGVPIKYDGTINLSVVGYTENGSTPGSGDLPSSVYFDGTTSSETVIFTAYTEGKVIITANDSALILTPENDLILTISSELIPDHIEVYANPSSIRAGGTDTSTITARVKTADNITINSYTLPFTFSTTAGSFYSSLNDPNKTVDPENGVATVELFPPTNSGTATITVSSGDLDNVTVKVGFYIDADHIQLVANPQHIEVKGVNPDTCLITATIKDKYNNTVYGYNGKVKFSIISGDAKFALTGSTIMTVVNGEAQIHLQAGNSPGTVKVKATSSFKNSEGIKTDIEGYLNIPVGISLELYGIPSYDSSGIVTFNINIQVAEFILEEMQVSWLQDNLETLNKIEIKSPSAADYIIVYNTNTDFPGSPASNEELINVNDITLSTGISTIIFYFSENMNGKEKLNITFNPNSGKYIIYLVQTP